MTAYKCLGFLTGLSLFYNYQKKNCVSIACALTMRGNKMRLKIVANTDDKTRIFLDSKDISMDVKHCEIEMEAGRPIRVYLDLVPDEIEFEGDVKQIDGSEEDD